MGSTIIRQDKLVLKGSPLAGNDKSGAENPQPFFRQPDLPVASGPGIPAEKKHNYGRETGFRLLPYAMQDRYNRKLVDMEFPSVVMENDYLRAEFVPALGGRLWSLFDKQHNRDIIYRNPVFRPANLSIRDAWFSGGIEWNIGRYGHAVHTCSPVYAGIIKNAGYPTLRLWEFERQTRLFWRIEFTLPDDSAALLAYFRVENPDSEEKPLYAWTNCAIRQTPGLRVLSAADEVIYLVPDTGKIKTMDYGHLPELPVLPGKDASYPSLSDYSNEYFFQNDKHCSADSLPWEAAVFEDGYAYGEMSAPPLLYRKMFCWGSGRGGRRWQDFLTRDGGEYLELQAGLAPTQLHCADISGRASVDWIQAFTSFWAEPEKAFQKDYRLSSAYVANRLTERIQAAALQAAWEQGRRRAGMEAEILSMGSGWGALERIMRNDDMPPGLSFPHESIGDAEAPWAELLKNGTLPLRPPEAGPGSFVTDKAWETLLKASPGHEGCWLTPYHLGVISFERGDNEAATAYWEESLKREENPWACRNLALAKIRSGAAREALDYYRRALRLPGSQDQSFAEEYIPLLMAEGKEAEAEAELDAYIRRAGSLEALPIPLLNAVAGIALSRGDDALLDRIFSIEHPHIREGNTTLVELWTERKIRQLGGGTMPKAQAEELLRKALAEGSLAIPREIDFRMYTPEERG